MPPESNRLLIVEDEPLLRITMADALRKEGWTVDVAEDGITGSAQFEQHLHRVVLSDLVMPRMGGLDLLKRIKALQPATTVVIMTAHGTVDGAVEAMREGAADFIPKPFSMAQLLVRLGNVASLRRLREQQLQQRQQPAEQHSFAKIIGKSQPMQEVFDLIRLVADADASVLIEGESGTGKELVAQAIHASSPRSSKPYLRVSCDALHESLVEAELLGYEKGAFPASTAERRIGRFEAASGGTLFLEEIAALPLAFQAKLLRVLQTRQIERVGSNRPIDIDVRVVCSTQRSLEEEIAAGRFREELRLQLSTVTIILPPLRRRSEDIPLLANAFLQELAEKRGADIEGFSDQAMTLLQGHRWSGNVRELFKVVERAILFCRERQITVNELPPALRRSDGVPPPSRDGILTMQQAVRRAEIEAILTALAATKGRRAEAARLLGISRKTLWEKIKHHDIRT